MGRPLGIYAINCVSGVPFGLHVKTICLNVVQDMHACCNSVSGGATAEYMRNDCMQAMGTLVTVLQHDDASEP